MQRFMSEENPQPPQDLEVLWTARQLAEYLSVANVTVYRWLSTGKVIDPTKIVRLGSSVRIPRSEVERIAGLKRKQITGQ